MYLLTCINPYTHTYIHTQNSQLSQKWVVRVRLRVWRGFTRQYKASPVLAFPLALLHCRGMPQEIQAISCATLAATPLLCFRRHARPRCQASMSRYQALLVRCPALLVVLVLVFLQRHVIVFPQGIIQMLDRVDTSNVGAAMLLFPLVPQLAWLQPWAHLLLIIIHSLCPVLLVVLVLQLARSTVPQLVSDSMFHRLALLLRFPAMLTLRRRAQPLPRVSPVLLVLGRFLQALLVYPFLS